MFNFGKRRNVQRGVHGTQNVATVNVKATYRITLSLGDPDTVFPDPVTSHAGRGARLQVLGLMKRPLLHADAFDCITFSWTHFKRLFAAELPNPVNFAAATNDAAAEVILNREVKRFWVSGAALPAKNAHAKLRVPGDYAVMWRKGDPEKANEPQYALDALPTDRTKGGNRYSVESDYYTDNPELGCIPILARVEVYDKPTTSWVAAPSGVALYFELVRPTPVPRGNALTGGQITVAGATTTAPAVAPKLRDSIDVRQNTMAPKDPKGGAGPSGYLKRHVDKYAAQDSRKKDPQRDNAHWHLGGKRGMADGGRDLLTTKATATGTRHNVFSTRSLTSFHAQGPTIQVAKAAPVKKTYAVQVDTNAAGYSGIIFMPSRVGGDAYQIRAYIDQGTKTAEAFTGVMTVWRTIRFCIDLRMETCASDPQLPNEMQQDFSNHNGCAHGEMLGYCGTCLRKDGALKPIDYAQLTGTFARAYCEVLFEPRAQTPITFADLDVQADMVRMRQALANDLAKNVLKVNGQIARGDGAKTHFAVQLAPNVQPGATLTLPDGEVDIPANGVIPANVPLGLTGGTLNHTTGALTFDLATAPTALQIINASYQSAPGLDLLNFLYFPQRSPFLINLRSLEGYAAAMNPGFAAPTCYGRDVTPHALTRATGSRYTGTVPTTPAKDPKVLVNGAALPADQYSMSFDEQTGDVEVLMVSKITDEVIGTGDGARTDFQANLAHPISQRLRLGQTEVALLSIDGLGNATTITSTRTIGGLMDKGVTVTYDFNASTVHVTTTDALPANAQLKLSYYTARTIPTTDVVTLAYQTTTLGGGGGPIMPSNDLSVTVNNFIEDHLLIAMVRALDDNRGFMPGIVLIRGGRKSTWSLYQNVQDQGKGISIGVILYGGNIYDGRTVNNVAQPATKVYTDILAHELGHSLYVNHFNSGAAAGPRNDLHDMYDVCLMGYGPSHFDFCGQCVAAYMGMNIHDVRLTTVTPHDASSITHKMPDPNDHTAAVSG